MDIVIGTHRLLQPDIRFKHLGLVILDEEHRFGVRQKERLKKLRAEVDVLTMTATPIPRTLNLALAALRDISLITTAPEGRLSVKTTVSEWNQALIREACLREIRRGGQVYYLHNEVRTIEKAARELAELLPEADIRVAHGQMPEHDLERIMLDFYHRRFNILVCSTIIESGIDVPTANTIVIERADKFGLAQLHQLRGRVGRSHHRAYAYLLIPGWGAVTEDARKRLEAIQSLEELGAGFALASHDLEIRGAGELLGESQSGAIDEVGFTLYAELLDRAVKSLRAGKTRMTEETTPRGTEVNLHAPALLPEDYLPGRAHAPGAVQAHRRLRNAAGSADAARGDHRPLRAAAGGDEAAVPRHRAENPGDRAWHPAYRRRTARYPHRIHTQAANRPGGDSEAGAVGAAQIPDRKRHPAAGAGGTTGGGGAASGRANGPGRTHSQRWKNK